MTQPHDINRRGFLKCASLASIATLAPALGKAVFAVPSGVSLMGNRFVTLCIMIRTTPWEVSRDVKLHPRDEYAIHTLEHVQSMREAFRQHNPEGRLTWGFTLNALEDKRPNFREIRDYVVTCQKRFGDEVSYFPGYFPAMHLPRARVNREMSEAIEIISELVGDGYRPQSIIGGFLSSDNLRYLAEEENIHAAHGVIWSQHAIDGGGADGSPSHPYYPSTEHFCKPAQGKDDFIDCVNLDGWSMDFICARRSGQNGHGLDSYCSRRGVGPIETYMGLGLELGHMQVMHTQSLHFDSGFGLNGFGWVPNIWEVALVAEKKQYGPAFIFKAMAKWVEGTKRRWPDVRFVSFGELGTIWRKHYKDNARWDYRFKERGLGIADSRSDLELRWFMNKTFRLALLRNWHENSPERVIDFTRYDLPAREPADPSPQRPVKDWSLMNRINQKGLRPQDKPILLSELTSIEKRLIAHYYPELMK